MPFLRNDFSNGHSQESFLQELKLLTLGIYLRILTKSSLLNVILTYYQCHYNKEAVTPRAGNNRFESIRWANRFESRIDSTGESIRYGKSKTNGVRFGRAHFVRSFSQERIAQHTTHQIMKDEGSSGHEIPERDVTYIVLYDYLVTTVPLYFRSGIFSK